MAPVEVYDIKNVEMVLGQLLVTRTSGGAVMLDLDDARSLGMQISAVMVRTSGRLAGQVPTEAGAGAVVSRSSAH
jgi:hypothetical protein